MTNKIYVTNGSGANVTVFDGDSETTVTTGRHPMGVAVNPVTDKIYVTNSGSNNVTVIDGATETAVAVAARTVPVAVAINPVTNKIYVTNSGSANVTVIDGATNATTTVRTDTNPSALAVNAVNNQIYAADRNSSNVRVITEQKVDRVPLQVRIAPLAGDTTESATPTFQLTATSNFAPTAPAIDGVEFQVDTWQGPWLAATNTGGNAFSATTPPLQPGVHILYA